MAGIIEGFRAALLGGRLDWSALAISAAIAARDAHLRGCSRSGASSGRSPIVI